MIYHYTNRDAALEIIHRRLISAHAVLVRTELLGGDEHTLAPAAWFTVAETPSPTVLAKMILGGWSLDQPGMVWRFACADEVAPHTLDEWAALHTYEPERFRWMLLTAQLAGESWQDWRLSEVGVPRESWLAVQSLHGDAWKDEPLP